MNIELIGYIAGGLVSLSFVPQVLKSWNTKRMEDISFSLTIINIVGQCTWIYYGFVKSSPSIIVMSTLTLLLTSLLLFMKIIYGNYRSSNVTKLKNQTPSNS